MDAGRGLVVEVNQTAIRARVEADFSAKAAERELGHATPQHERTNGPPTAAISALEPGAAKGRKMGGRKISPPLFLPLIFLPDFGFMGRNGVREKLNHPPHAGDAALA
jgi:hypothetical protein